MHKLWHPPEKFENTSLVFLYGLRVDRTSRLNRPHVITFTTYYVYYIVVLGIIVRNIYLKLNLNLIMFYILYVYIHRWIIKVHLRVGPRVVERRWYVPKYNYVISLRFALINVYIYIFVHNQCCNVPLCPPYVIEENGVSSYVSFQLSKINISELSVPDTLFLFLFLLATATV